MQTDVADPLEQITLQLTTEFGERVKPEDLRHQAEASLARFSDARVTAFVPMLALRDARAHLEQQLSA
jgi:hypothetical protein